MDTIEVKWGTSRGQNSYGYTTCSLWHQGRRVAACNGGGYDLRGTVFGSFLARQFADRLRMLAPEHMPKDRRHGRPNHEDVPERQLYGLVYVDPDYDPGKAVIGTDCTNRTMGAKDEVTVAEAEEAGQSFGLERYQAAYAATSPYPTEHHTEPSINGACGIVSVRKIARAIGLDWTRVSGGRGARATEVFILHDTWTGKPEPWED